jgi:hypothetical protein
MTQDLLLTHALEAALVLGRFEKGGPGLKIVQTLMEHTSPQRIELFNLLRRCQDPFKQFSRFNSRSYKHRNDSEDERQQYAMMTGLRPHLAFCGYLRTLGQGRR